MAWRRNDLQSAAKALASAKDLLHDARKKLARSTVAGDPHYIVDSRWGWAGKLLAERRESLLAIDGVLAAALGHRMRRGLLTDEPCVTVCVRKKISAADMKSGGYKRIPKFIRKGKKRLPIDIVELGEIDRQAQAGNSIGPESELRTGTLGAFAIDESTRRSVAITAMHVSGLTDMPPAGAPALRFCQPSREDSQGSPMFATLVGGTMHGIDAARLDVHAQPAPTTTFPNGKIVAGWRPTSFPGDRGTVVWMWGARSGLVTGFIVNPNVAIPSWELDAAILVNISSQHGDSGAALVDSSNLVLGFLVGAGGPEQNNLRIFVPAGLVFARLKCDIPTT